MALDPSRFVRARLANSSHKLPWGQRLFGDNADEAGFETVDLWDSHVSMLLAGGSIVRAPRPAAEPAPVAIAEPEPIVAHDD